MAACSSKSKLSEKKFHNWIKSGLAILYTRDGLQPFVIDEISAFQRDIYDNILAQLNIATDSECSACTTDALVCDKKIYDRCKRKRCGSFHRECPEGGLCDQFKEIIKIAHRYNGPSWVNTDAQLWCSDPWQVAKCYMPREGYITQMTAEETDFNGIVSVILNHKNFSRRLSTNLTDKVNIFRQAQTVSKEFRHSASLEVEDDELKNNIDILMKLLQEKEVAQYQEAQDAMQKLSELGKPKWSISTSKDDISAVMKSACTSGVMPEADEGKEKDEMLKLAVKVIEANTKTDVKSVIWQMQTSFNEYKERKEETRKRKDMCKKLIKSYQLDCSTLPISALFEEEDAPLLNFYVQPMMQQVDYHIIRKNYTTVKSYYDVFHKDGRQCRNIYITGNAGTGKTAVCQKMVLCWCHAQTEGMADDNFSQEDIDAMKLFDFLFFVSLRDTEKCHVNDIIQQQLFTADKKDLIDQVLEDEKCLIILDGLDEWSHPKSTKECPVNKKVPHRNASDNCVYLTTSRPWKLEANRLNIKEIDQQIELKGLDKKASDKLTSFIVNHLNKKYSEERNPREFRESVEKKKQVENVSEIPIIKIQLVSLWFRDIDISTNYSRCAIYADTVEMLFSRAMEREKMQSDVNRMSDRVKQMNIAQSELHTPASISQLPLLTDFVYLLYKIGNLAFDMFFGTPEGESELIFKRGIGKRYELSDIEMDILLFVGILSKNKVIGPQRDRMIKLSFLHKSYQEYFAALYISMNKEHENIEQYIFSKCNSSLVEFLKYEQMFVFLTGMNVQAMENISTEVRKMVAADRDVKTYRQSAHYKFGFVVVLKPYNNLASELFEQERNGRGALRALQTLLLNCLEESDSAGLKRFDLPLSDVFIDEEYPSELENLLRNNSQHVRSVSTEVYTTDMAALRKLEKLVVNENTYTDSCRVDIGEYEKCISSSSSYLVSLSLANCKGKLGLSTHNFKALTSFALFDVLLKHQELVDVCGFISATEALTQLFLCGIKCFDHEDKCTGSKLDLSRHSELRFLRLQGLYEHGSHHTKLNTKNLQFLVVQDNSKGIAVNSIIEDIRNAPKLTEVVFLSFDRLHLIDHIIDTIPTLSCLERLSFFNVNFGDRVLQLNTRKEQPIKMVSSLNTSLTLHSFCTFVDSLPNKGAIVHIQASRLTHVEGKCTTEIDMEEAAKYVRAKGTFEVTLVERGRLAFNSKC
ncbi:uncharacterized protein LOC128553639 [Mercenaria mercenaria]|uniref:uncharacterized protein LOC128553639 n=1 Tax=Mercenaria mercenaria TaxID=6596 RepID=UPI00234ECEC7|nr:uncharacterized protein LOC128553639 [Mercenaria mercenaria]